MLSLTPTPLSFQETHGHAGAGAPSGDGRPCLGVACPSRPPTSQRASAPPPLPGCALFRWLDGPVPGLRSCNVDVWSTSCFDIVNSLILKDGGSSGTVIKHPGHIPQQGFRGRAGPWHLARKMERVAKAARGPDADLSPHGPHPGPARGRLTPRPSRPRTPASCPCVSACGTVCHHRSHAGRRCRGPRPAVAHVLPRRAKEARLTARTRAVPGATRAAAHACDTRSPHTAPPTRRAAHRARRCVCA